MPKKPEAIENLDPRDDTLLEKVLPGIIPEHIARYNFVREFLDTYGLANDPVVLDLGSGRGYGSDILRKKFPRGKVFGFELSEKYTTKAIDNYGNKDKSPHFTTADVLKLPIKANEADIVTAFEIVEHLPKENQQILFDQIYKVLKPGGHAFISFPERYSFYSDGEEKITRSSFPNKHHLYEPTHNEVEAMITESKLIVEGVYGQNYVNQHYQRLVYRLNKFIPIYSTFAWAFKRPRDVSIRTENEKVPLTHMYVVTKPENNF